jgi:hypothetical protein
MTKAVSLLTLPVTVLVGLLPLAPAQAQSIRTFVSTAGSDSNPCSIIQPCRHFQAAVNATAVGGEVDALDAGAYGSFTISQAISIEGEGWSYIAPPANGAAITLVAVSGNVNIRGVSLDGVGTSGTDGIDYNGGSGSLNIQDSVIRNFGNEGGIFFQPTASSQLSVSNTLISDNSADAILIFPIGSGTTTGVLDHVVMENNAGSGLNVSSSTQTVKVTVGNSVLANNIDGVGISSDGAPIEIMVRNCAIANNTSLGLTAVGLGATIWVTRSTITGNATAWNAVNSGVVTSYADNNIDGNTNANTAPPQTGYR